MRFDNAKYGTYCNGKHRGGWIIHGVKHSRLEISSAMKRNRQPLKLPVDIVTTVYRFIPCRPRPFDRFARSIICRHRFETFFNILQQPAIPGVHLTHSPLPTDCLQEDRSHPRTHPQCGICKLQQRRPAVHKPSSMASTPATSGTCTQLTQARLEAPFDENALNDVFLKTAPPRGQVSSMHCPVFCCRYQLLEIRVYAVFCAYNIISKRRSS